MPARLVVKLTWGAESPERVSQALSVAATAAAADVEVSLWLTGEATLLACPGALEAIELAHAPALSDLRDVVLAAGSITACSQCAARRELVSADFLPSVRIAGSSTFVEEILHPSATALVY